MVIQDSLNDLIFIFVHFLQVIQIITIAIFNQNLMRCFVLDNLSVISLKLFSLLDCPVHDIHQSTEMLLLLKLKTFDYRFKSHSLRRRQVNIVVNYFPHLNHSSSHHI